MKKNSVDENSTTTNTEGIILSMQPINRLQLCMLRKIRDMEPAAASMAMNIITNSHWLGREPEKCLDRPILDSRPLDDYEVQVVMSLRAYDPPRKSLEMVNYILSSNL